MKRRVIFVGVHNKPGLTPLCSSTRSGKLIDRIIGLLPPYDFEVVKSNLHDTEEFPKAYDRKEAVEAWKQRVNYNTDDVVVLLGACVHKDFRNSDIPNRIHIGHPAGVRANNAKDVYVLRAHQLIRNSPLPKPF